MKTVLSVTKLASVILENPHVFLIRENAPKEPKALIKYLRSHCETYGNDTFCYLPLANSECRNVLEDWLVQRGHKVGRGWNKGGSAIALKVSYFKSRGWDV